MPLRTRLALGARIGALGGYSVDRRGDDGRWRIHSRRFSPAFSSYAPIPVPEHKPAGAADLPQARSKGK